MRRTYERGTKARGGLHAPVNMADSMEEVMSVEKENAGNGTLAALYIAIFHTPSFHISLVKFFGTSIVFLGPERVQLLISAKSVMARQRS